MSDSKFKFEVLSIGKDGRQIGASVYVSAANSERALSCGKYWRRVIGFQPSKRVIARPYYPWLDSDISMYIKETSK